MSRLTEAQQCSWMAQWHQAAITLERIRAQELQSIDLARIAADLDDLSLLAARARGRSTTSGLIAQQAALHRRQG